MILTAPLATVLSMSDMPICQVPILLRLVSVPTGWSEERDYYLLCSCGWCSLPYVQPPAKRVCEACEALADGRRVFSKFFAPQSGKHGYQVEWTAKGEPDAPFASGEVSLYNPDGTLGDEGVARVRDAHRRARQALADRLDAEPLK